mmetsp:Transcript_32789/g.55774  ORF Transcript_32789/g.55774 Transcript_32789/m.55774 type:complete len:295 (+) Transcript_32789:134-1018(+)|eukprot:CAMPEP_0183722638 /NCGR_PEP_ID=MMETSP0737-20130205/14537_1 /TAXON_ID=385413 /ORGANISM="Thalassiosira miniscula, Strain CCMP1093" /LENGTH=294 /DNA_ID=CAMNT_0025952845 /DNA_START=266 /DNA_END=1150 /DNA_ORIENTATION=+
MEETKKYLHRHHHHAPFIQDLDLMNVIMFLWLSVAVIGLLMNSCVEHFHLETWVPTFSSSFAPHTDSSDGVWTHLESHGDVELLYRTIIPTKGLHAHRAVAVADIPMETMLHVFRDTPNNVRWAKDLKESEEFHKSGAHHKGGNTQTQTSVIRQRYNVPIPGFADREFLMNKKMTAVENSDGTHSAVTYDFVSLNDEESNNTNIELCNGCVRATNLGSKWTFTSLDDGTKTKIEVDVAVDPKTPSLSTFFINLFQKRWSYASVHGLMKEARHHLHRDKDVLVANTFFRVFPLKI